MRSGQNQRRTPPGGSNTANDTPKSLYISNEKDSAVSPVDSPQFKSHAVLCFRCRPHQFMNSQARVVTTGPARFLSMFSLLMSECSACIRCIRSFMFRANDCARADAPCFATQSHEPRNSQSELSTQAMGGAVCACSLSIMLLCTCEVPDKYLTATTARSLTSHSTTSERDNQFLCCLCAQLPCIACRPFELSLERPS